MSGAGLLNGWTKEQKQGNQEIIPIPDVKGRL